MEDADSVEMPRQVYCELKTLRQMGVDLTDADAVTAGLERYNFDAALDWVLDDPEAYVEAVRSGMTDETVAAEET